MKTLRFNLLVAAAAAGAAAFPGSAWAIGCNGIINPTVAGCSRSDENEGPNFPYYRAAKTTIPANGVKIEIVQGVPMVQYQGQWTPVLSAGAGRIVIPARP